MAYSMYIPDNIDKYKPEQVYITDADKGWVDTIPYYIKEVVYLDDDEYILKHLNLQMEQVDVYVWRRPKYMFSLLITRQCNLSCNHCNSFSQFKSMWDSNNALKEVKNLIKALGKDIAKQSTIAVTGGEPLLAKNIYNALDYLKIVSSKVILLTNGLLPKKLKIVKAMQGIAIENSAKEKHKQPEFHPVLQAPIDDPAFKDCDSYKNGCSIAKICGQSYYKGRYAPCVQAFAIEEVFGLQDVTSDKPLTDEELKVAFDKACRYCGSFKRLGYHKLDKAQFSRTTTNEMSKSWQERLKKWLM